MDIDLDIVFESLQVIIHGLASKDILKTSTEISANLANIPFLKIGIEQLLQFWDTIV